MTWSLLLGSPQNGQAVLYLFWRHLVSCRCIHSSSHCERFWNRQKMFGGTCAVNPLSPVCHVNPMLITNIYSKTCDIWQLQNLRVAGYHNFTDIGTVYLMATSWTDLTIQFVTCYPVLSSMLQFIFPFHHYLYNNMFTWLKKTTQLTNETPIFNGWTFKIGAGCCRLME